jgi:hypothetical protein
VTQERRGSCHCGNVRWILQSSFAFSDLPMRACQCSFCRKHGAVSTSDPKGESRFLLKDRACRPPFPPA